METCRFCHEWHTRSAMIKYSTRHYAHLKCAHERGRAEKMLADMRPWQRGQLPALELIDLGLLDYVRSLPQEPA